MANLERPEQARARLVTELMRACGDVGKALRIKVAETETLARQAVQVAKLGLGERGPTWWSDGAPDYNRHMMRNTPYAQCYAALGRE